MPSPYAELFIYQLEGRLEPQSAIEAGAYLGHWQEEGSAFLFFSAPMPSVVDAILRRQPHLRLIDSTHMAYDQWQGAFAGAEPIGCFHIVAPWHAASPDPAEAGRIPILLDPGLVFGAGTHPTTRDCLYALDLAADCGRPKTVMDLGTGTGILALAAARRLQARVLAVDLNFLAARTAARNVRLNRLEDRILTAQARAEDAVAGPADLVVANLHGQAMLRTMEAPGFRRKRW
ncbi:MAG TPA: 50S ribosomal protein L11 methyltransferase, partial [Desulfobacterales bacterium]|nr:50S ribosomal protein L11 methyltransferase [Desulfobacterales bacterium]